MRINGILKQLIALEGEAFVSEVYRQLLDREPDPDGLAHHTELLAGGMSKMTLVAKILQSPECSDRNRLDDLAPPNKSLASTINWVHQSGTGSCTLFEWHSYDQPVEPKTTSAEIHQNFRIPIDWPQFVGVVPRGRVVGHHGSVITPDGELLWDVCADYSNHTPELHPVMSIPKLPPMTYRRETIASVSIPWHANYYHWMFDVLPRFELIRRSGIRVDSYLISSDPSVAFQQETLNALGIPRSRLIQCGPDTHIKADELVVTSMPGFAGKPPLWACLFLRQKLMLDRHIHPAPGRSKLYISRAGSTSRRIRNEPQLAAVLQAYGFQIIQLEKLSVSDQARLFASADVIVSPHGASLTNLVFCSPGTKVIELFSPIAVLSLYWHISCSMRLDYYYLIGTAVHGQHGADYDIDLNEVQVLLHRAGCNV